MSKEQESSCKEAQCYASYGGKGQREGGNSATFSSECLSVKQVSMYDKVLVSKVGLGWKLRTLATFRVVQRQNRLPWDLTVKELRYNTLDPCLVWV